MAIRRRRGRELVAVKRKLLAEGSDVWRGDGAGAASEASRASLGDAPSDLPDSSLSVDGSGGEGKGKRARVQAVSAASAVVTGPALGSLARETPTKRPGRAGRGAALASSARRRAILPRTHERVKSEGGQMTLLEVAVERADQVEREAKVAVAAAAARSMAQARSRGTGAGVLHQSGGLSARRKRHAALLGATVAEQALPRTSSIHKEEAPVSPGADFSTLGNKGVAAARRTATKRNRARSREVASSVSVLDRAEGLLDRETWQLPPSHKALFQQFKALDTALSTSRQGRKATLASVTPFVENASHHNFRRRHLAQMLSVIPDCYCLEIDTRLGKTAAPIAARTVSADEQLKIGLPAGVGIKHLVARRRDFLKRLHEFVDVEEIPLGKMPQQTVVKAMTANDILAAAEATESVAVKRAIKLANQRMDATDSSAGGSAATSKSLVGLPASLIAKVKSRERDCSQQSSVEVLRAKEHDRMQSEQPVLVNLLRRWYTSSRKPSFSEQELLSKLKRNWKQPISDDNAVRMLKDCTTLLPEWITRKKLSSGWYYIKSPDQRLSASEVQKRLAAALDKASPV